MSKLVALTGAGISVASGIGTFKDSKIDWREVLDREYANERWEDFCEDYANFIKPIVKAIPNDAHLALSDYEIPVITANVDCLHTKAGSHKVYEIHGSCEWADPTLDTIVLYGDMPTKDYQDAFGEIEHKKDVDLLIIGTSLYTNTLQELVIAYRMTSENNIYVIDENAEVNVRKFLEAYEKGEDVYKYCMPYSDFKRVRGITLYDSVMEQLGCDEDSGFGSGFGNLNFEEA